MLEPDNLPSQPVKVIELLACLQPDDPIGQSMCRINKPVYVKEHED